MKNNNSTYQKIPGTILPDGLSRVMYPGVKNPTSYAHYDHPDDCNMSILFPRKGCGYDLEKPIYARNGTFGVYVDNQLESIDTYEFERDNEIAITEYDKEQDRQLRKHIKEMKTQRSK